MARRPVDPLRQWLSLTWERPERSYNPDVRDFLSALLGYPKQNVLTEDAAGSGYPDIKLLSPDGIPWIVGDLRRSDEWLADPSKRDVLWADKRKYVSGSTRYALFLTASYIWVVLPTGVPLYEDLIELRSLSLGRVQDLLRPLSYEAASHERRWAELVEGELPYSYLKLHEPAVTTNLKNDLQNAFDELTRAARDVLKETGLRYTEYVDKRRRIETALSPDSDTRRRALRALERHYDFERNLYEGAFAQFEQQYGGEVDANGEAYVRKRITEAFLADSAAALIARVLFLRLLEDIGLTQKRRLSNGGPKNWAAFVEQLTGDATQLVRLAGHEAAMSYPEPFSRSIFDWIQEVNSNINLALQRLIISLNAYDLSGLSEEILGTIYQEFLPRQKRRQLGEYYTPVSIVDWILQNTVWSHGTGTLLDPACGSGSFLLRYVHRQFEEGVSRGVDPTEIAKDLAERVCGFDLNPFAAFLTQFQLMWAFLRHERDGSFRRLHVYNLNSLLKDLDLFGVVGKELLPPGHAMRDDGKWDYIVGNPPYIRAERAKGASEVQKLWPMVWGQNADTGLVFLYRAMTEWLKDGGHLGMVVSGGYANSEAAAEIWRLLQPGGQCRLRQLVWLEFVEENERQSKIWDASRIPMIIVVEKATPKREDEIELFVPSQWPENPEPARIAYGAFFDNAFNPRTTNVTGSWGEYLLPLLSPGDIPILRRISPHQDGVAESRFAVDQHQQGRSAWWRYGIQRGGAEGKLSPDGARPLRVIASNTIAAAYPGDSLEWIDLEEVRRQEYGKVSLWRTAVPTKFLIAPEISRAPAAAVVTCSEADPIAALNTACVALPLAEGPAAEVVAAYLNSSLVRFYWALVLRSGVVQGYYAHVYPRSLNALPWPRNPSSKFQETLESLYHDLAQIARESRANPTEWLLEEAERRLERQRLRLSDSNLGLRFDTWTGIVTPDEVVVRDAVLDGGDAGYLDCKDGKLALLVYHLLTGTEISRIGATTLQRVVIPADYAEMVTEFQARQAVFEDVPRRFRETMRRVDEVVFDEFGMSDEERAYVLRRLLEFPLNRLRPRMPWEVTKPRAGTTYSEDRFA